MWLCKYNSSLSSINNGWDKGNAVDGKTAHTKDELISAIKFAMMDGYRHSPKLDPQPEAGVQYCIKVKCVDGNIYWYDLVDLDELDNMDKGFYKYEYEEYVSIRDRLRGRNV